MNDEKKGAVLTGEELDEIADRFSGKGQLYDGSGDYVTDFEELQALLESARLARLAGQFLEQHAPTIRSWLCPSNGENPSELDAAIVACLEALSSTIAAFRKGAE